MTFLLTFSQLSGLHYFTSRLSFFLPLVIFLKITFHYDTRPFPPLIWTLTRKTKLWERECCCEPPSSDGGRQRALHAHIWWSWGSSELLLQPFSAWKGDAAGRRWDVLNAFIIVTSSLMWSRHSESVAHAAREGWRADWETASFENLQIAGAHICLLSFLGGSKDFFIYIWKCLYYYIKPVQVL